MPLRERPPLLRRLFRVSVIVSVSLVFGIFLIAMVVAVSSH
jgi:hypothetical protein